MMLDPLAEPVYPLEKAEFARALAAGLGRAMIHAERCGAEGVRDLILDAALDPKLYDIQCNGYGEEWLAKLCSLAGLVDTVIAADPGGSGREAKLRCRLLKEFGLQGHATARTALREMCRFDEESDDMLACDEIVELEGEEGFIFVAERLGERLLADKEFQIYPTADRVLDEKSGEGTAMAILERESPGNPRIAGYREAVIGNQARIVERKEQPRPAAEQIREMILTSDKRLWRLRSYGEKATMAERLEVASLDFTKLGALSLENYLNYFQETGFPEFREEYLELLRTAEERNRWRAHAVLSHHAHPAVRRAAYEAHARGEASYFVRLLCSSGLREDTEPVLDAISAPEILADEDECHEIGLRLLELVENNPAMDDVRLLLWTYQNNPCMCCRYSAVRHMVGRSILPEWATGECLADAEEDIRKMAAEYRGAPQG